MRATGAPVVGVSPIVGGAPVRGMADACLAAIGVETSAGAVAVHYGARGSGAGVLDGSGAGVLDGWLVDSRDSAELARVREAGVIGRAVPLMMTDPDATAAIAAAALDLAADLAAERPTDLAADPAADLPAGRP